MPAEGGEGQYQRLARLLVDLHAIMGLISRQLELDASGEDPIVDPELFEEVSLEALAEVVMRHQDGGPSDVSEQRRRGL